MTALVLHYVHDPLCGWCYGATPLVEAASGAGLDVALHGGALWDQPTTLTTEKQRYVRNNDDRIAELTGMSFGAAYLETLLSDPSTMLWSGPTLSAILAAGSLRKGADLAMLHAIQQAHYVQGMRVVETPVLASLSERIGLAPATFLDAFQLAPVDEHVRQSRQLMTRFGLSGFPGFVLAYKDARVRVSHEPFYERPEAFVQQLHAIAYELA